MTTPLKFSRQPLTTPDQAGRVHDLAKRILKEVGLEILHPGALECVRQAGFRISGNRVFFEPAVVEEHVEEMRHWIASRSFGPPPEDDGVLWLRVSVYSLNVHDVVQDRVVPYTTESLIEMCKLIDSLAGERVRGAPPGFPMDLPAPLRPVAQFRLASLYCRQGSTAEVTSAQTVHYMLDMAEVMGRPMRRLPVYMPSPLRLAGESLEAVLSCLDRLERISVSSMPSTGATAPIHPFGALALSAAELMGGMVTLRLLTGKPVTFGVSLFPFDLRANAMVFGSPENMLYQMLTNDLNRFYGWPWDPAVDNIHVMSKVPDFQSAADKAAILTMGAFLGNREFNCAGTLSLDEVFSPVQLLLDCEIRDWVQRAIQGVWMGEEAVDDWLAEIRSGIQRGFMGLDSTLDHYRRHTWYPERFERGFVSQWLARGQPRLYDKLCQEVQQRIARFDYELDVDRRKDIERIYQAAVRSVTG